MQEQPSIHPHCRTCMHQLHTHMLLIKTTHILTLPRKTKNMKQALKTRGNNWIRINATTSPQLFLVVNNWVCTAELHQLFLFFVLAYFQNWLVNKRDINREWSSIQIPIDVKWKSTDILKGMLYGYEIHVWY